MYLKLETLLKAMDLFTLKGSKLSEIEIHLYEHNEHLQDRLTMSMISEGVKYEIEMIAENEESK